MRLPRVRFTVGTLLFSVAVAAANLWAFRRLTETEVSVFGSVSYRVLPAGVGVIPLVDAALVGIWLCASRRLRSVRQRYVGTPRSSSLSATYFRLQLLMLGGLAYLFMPDAVGTIRELLECATEISAEGWAVCFGDPDETGPWLIAESALLGVLVSGPPLVLSWIGQMLAKRCAATLPWPRFLALTGLVTLGFASAGLAIAVMPQPFEDEQEIAIDFQVVDRDSGRPIAAAFLCIADPFSYDPDSVTPRAFADVDGHARLTGRFVASGERNAFRTMGTFSPWGRWLEVSAAGHRMAPCRSPRCWDRSPTRLAPASAGSSSTGGRRPRMRLAISPGPIPREVGLEGRGSRSNPTAGSHGRVRVHVPESRVRHHPAARRPDRADPDPASRRGDSSLDDPGIPAGHVGSAPLPFHGRRSRTPVFLSRSTCSAPLIANRALVTAIPA